eukprot:12441059-Alexandrium_andersonii.AAC.1
MSASLVGSEMCIRDRRRRNPAGNRRKPCCTMCVLRNCSSRRLSGSRLVAVSYTHLTLPTICSV